MEHSNENELKSSQRRDVQRVRAFCSRCHHVQLFKREKPNHALHLFLSVITAGMWLISWLSVAIMANYQPWQCQRCGWYLPRRITVRSRDQEIRPPDIPPPDFPNPGQRKAEAPSSSSDGTVS